MKKLILTGTVALFLVNSASAQQIPFYSQYFNNPLVYNPALTGSSEQSNVWLTHRSQWTKIPGAPVTNALTLDGPLSDQNMGLGLSLYSDVTDITTRTGASGLYSYKLKIDDNSKVHFGLAFGALSHMVDFSKAIVQDNTDPNLFAESQRRTTLDANFGIAYTWKALEIGVAVPQIFANRIRYENNDSRTYYNLSRHFLASAKYAFDVNKDKGMTAYPLILMRAAPNVPIQYDINAVFDWKKIGWLGVSYRSEYAVGVSLGLRYKALSAGVSYDIITSSLSEVAGSSTEVMLGFTFGKKKEAVDSAAIKERQQADDKVDKMLMKMMEENNKNKEEIEKLKEELQKKGSGGTGMNTPGSESSSGSTASAPSSGSTSGTGASSPTASLTPITTGVTTTGTSSPTTTSATTTSSSAEGMGAKLSPDQVKTATVNEFTNEAGARSQAGYYVVVGSFSSKENTESFKRALAAKGYSGTKYLYNPIDSYFYIYTKMSENKDVAAEQFFKVQADYRDAWIQKLE